MWSPCEKYRIQVAPYQPCGDHSPQERLLSRHFHVIFVNTALSQACSPKARLVTSWCTSIPGGASQLPLDTPRWSPRLHQYCSRFMTALLEA